MNVIELPGAEIIDIGVEHRRVASVVELAHARVPSRFESIDLTGGLRVCYAWLILREEVVLLHKGLPVLIAIEPLQRGGRKKESKGGDRKAEGRMRRVKKGKESLEAKSTRRRGQTHQGDRRADLT